MSAALSKTVAIPSGEVRSSAPLSERLSLKNFPVERDVMILGIIMATLQMLDGILTAVGMFHFGTNAEGNAFIRTLMETMGYGPALVMVKSVAIAIVGALCLLSSRVSWLPNALKGMIALYLCAAIIPWSWILWSRVL